MAMAAFTFTACEDVPEPYVIPGQNGTGSVTVTEPAGDGSLESPFNVAGVLNHLQNSEDISGKVYVKGKISQIEEVDNSNFGNATFYISDDGTTNNQFYIYRCFSLNNEKFKSADEIKVGDEVVIYGNVTIYNGKYETTANAAYIYSLNGQTSGNAGGAEGAATGDGTLANPYNSVAANNYASSLAADEVSANDVYIKGKVVSISLNYDASGTYGNARFNISDDGTSANQFICYNTLYLGNKKWTSLDDGPLLKVGDEVIVCGKVTNFKGNTPETASGKSYLYSLNSTGGSGTGGDEPEQPTEGRATVTKAGYIVTIVDPTVTESSNTITCDFNTCGWTANAFPTPYTLSDGTTISFSQEDGYNTPIFHTGTKGVRMYALNSMTITGSKPIAKIVATCDVYNGVNEVGNDQMYTSVSSNIWKVVNDYTDIKGGTQFRPQVIVITYAN